MAEEDCPVRLHQSGIFLQMSPTKAKHTTNSTYSQTPMHGVQSVVGNMPVDNCTNLLVPNGDAEIYDLLRTFQKCCNPIGQNTLRYGVVSIEGWVYSLEKN